MMQSTEKKSSMVAKPDITRQDIDKALSEIQSEKFARFVGLMPLILLWMRVEMDYIFKSSYPIFFSETVNEDEAMKLINKVITKLLDPNLFCSRFR
jgi:hypothetical protein